MTSFRFSCNVLGINCREELVDTCSRAERLGYDTVFTADHLGAPSPFPVLVAAAEATQRLRVGTLVLNAPFWNAALLAREAATTDILTGGRLELGLGAGHMKWEFEEAGIEWERFDARADRLAATITELGRQFAGDSYAPKTKLRNELGLPALRPVQRHGFGACGPPLIVGGTGDRILRIAANHADTISVPGLVQVPGRAPGTLRLGTATEADDRIRYARACADQRIEQVEWHCLIQTVVQTDDRRTVAKQLAEQATNGLLTPEDVLETPFVLIGTVQEMAEELCRNRDRYGFTYYTVHGPYMDTFAPVIERAHAIER